MAFGKKYRAAAEKIEAGKLYPLSEAIALAIETSTVKFDASVELHVRTSADPKYSEQAIRGTVVLPHGTGKKIRIAAIVSAELEKAARDAGAELVGNKELIDAIAGGTIDFDVLVASDDMMKDLSKVAKVLGPKGLMPSPKNGTVTKDPATAIAELKAGKVEYKVDKQGILHVGIGKVSFGASKVAENAAVLLRAIADAKPATIKGTYIKSITATSSMGPGVPVNPGEIA